MIPLIFTVCPNDTCRFFRGQLHLPAEAGGQHLGVTAAEDRAPAALAAAWTGRRDILSGDCGKIMARKHHFRNVDINIAPF